MQDIVKKTVALIPHACAVGAAVAHGAVETLEPELLNRMPGFRRHLEWFIENRPDLTGNVACMRTEGMGERRLLSVLTTGQLT